MDYIDHVRGGHAPAVCAVAVLRARACEARTAPGCQDLWSRRGAGVAQETGPVEEGGQGA